MYQQLGRPEVRVAGKLDLPQRVRLCLRDIAADSLGVGFFGLDDSKEGQKKSGYLDQCRAEEVDVKEYGYGVRAAAWGSEERSSFSRGAVLRSAHGQVTRCKG